MTGVSAALDAFYTGFGLPAYAEGRVPSKAVLPYITYTIPDPGWRGSAVQQGRIWYRSASVVPAAQKADEIAAFIGEGVTLPADGGYVTLAPGVPFMQLMDAGDPFVALVYINLEMGAYIARKGP